jgi:hypothetical protein
MMPFALSDEELDLLMTLAQPLPPHARPAFVEAVLAQAAKYGVEVGPGVLHRIGAGLQRSFALPPIGHQPAGAARSDPQRVKN